MAAKKRKLGRGVSIIGGGMSKFGAFAEKTTRDLFGEAYFEAIGSVSKGIDPEAIEALYVGNFSADLFEGQGHLGHLMADWVGLAPRPRQGWKGLAQAAAWPSGKASWR